MKASEAIFLIHQRLGGAEGLEARVKVELALAQSKVEQMHPKPWFLLTILDPIEITEAGYTRLPAGYLFEYEDPTGRGSFWLKNDDGTATQLTRGSYAELFMARTEGTDPTHYDILGDTAYFFPKPDRTRQFVFIYYNLDVPLTTEDVESKVLRYYPDLVIGLAGSAMATFAGDPEAIQYFVGEGSAAQERLTRDTEARSQQNRSVTANSE